MGRNKIFLDTSILVTAALSSRGGSFYILTQMKEKYQFQINKYVLDELHDLIEGKFLSDTDFQSRLFFLLGVANVEILENPSRATFKKLLKFINTDDVPILSSALQHSNYLLTLDKAFLQPKVKDFAKTRGLLIYNPREFLKSPR